MFEKIFKDFNLNFNALNESNTFSSGDLATGQISFELSKVTKIRSITMCMSGKADVHWSSGSRKRRRTYRAKIDFFNLKSMILQEGGRCLPVPPPAQQHCKLQYGTHTDDIMRPRTIAANIHLSLLRQ